MKALQELFGYEHDFDKVTRALRHFVERQRPSVVGALHVTCSDESERECIEAFQHGFVDALLPDLKLWSKAPFRTSNLGGRYEWGAVRIAEQHFATAESRRAFKTVVVKINAHVSVEQTGDRTQFGRMVRYDAESVACGALHALLDGEHQPFARDLHDAFHVDGKDLLATLRNPERVDPAHRSLFAAIVGARVQARRAVLDVQDYTPNSPTVYVILPCVTLNRSDRDTELTVGAYTADHRTEDRKEQYCGLGDDPDGYELSYESGQLVVRDEHVSTPRPARDHRKHLLRQWQQSAEHQAQREKLQRNADFEAFLAQGAQKRHHDHRFSKKMLKAGLQLLADLNPVSAAVVLFSKGVAGIYHTHRIHKLLRDVSNDHLARQVLVDINNKVESLPPEEAQKVIDVILDHYGS